jgi:nucleoporin NUP159
MFISQNIIPNANMPQTLGFKAIARDTKLRLFPNPWASDNLPPGTSALLSVASSKSLLAAAGPDTLIIASTANVRKAFTSGEGDGNVKTFTPELTIPVPRLSQVVFTSDGNYLIIAAERGGGLQVYSTENLLKNNKTPAFEISTDAVAVRSIIPNPAVESAHLIAVIMNNGHLMIANLQQRAFARSASGQPSLRDGVTSASWSVRGRQIVVGLQDGTAAQLDPTGAVKAAIPRPPDVDASNQGSWISFSGRRKSANIRSGRNFLAL